MIEPDREASRIYRLTGWLSRLSAALKMLLILGALLVSLAVSYKATAAIAITLAVLAFVHYTSKDSREKRLDVLEFRALESPIAGAAPYILRHELKGGSHPRTARVLPFVLAAIVAVIAILVVLATALTSYKSSQAPPRPVPRATPGIAQMAERCPALHATITPRDTALTSFSALLQCASQRARRFVAVADRSGFAVAEVSLFTPAHPVQIEARDFPANAFYQAAHAQGLYKSPFNDKETIFWSVNADDSVAFSYVTPAFLRYRSLLDPFLGLRGFGAILSVLLVIILYWLFDKLVMPLVSDWFKDWIKKRFQKAHQP